MVWLIVSAILALASPIEMPGCSDAQCSCVVSLKKPVTLYEEPSRRSRVVGILKPGNLDDDSLVSVVAKRGLARVRGKRVTYLGYFEESDGGIHFILIDGRPKEVSADDVEEVLVEPVVETWARLASGGVTGYAASLDAVVRGVRGKGGKCELLKNARP